MRRVLLGGLLAVGACAAPPTPAPRPRLEPIELRVVGDALESSAAPLTSQALVRETDAPEAPGVFEEIFVWVEPAAIETTDASLDALGIEFPRPKGARIGPVFDATPLDSFQVAVFADREREEWTIRPRARPVLAVGEGSRARLLVRVAADERLRLDLRALVSEQQVVRLQLLGTREKAGSDGERAYTEISVRKNGTALLRFGEGAGRRWIALTVGVISLRDEDARRFDLDDE